MGFVWIVMFVFTMILWGQNGNTEYLELAKFCAVLSTAHELIIPLYMLIKEKVREINIRNDMNQIKLEKMERGQND